MNLKDLAYHWIVGNDTPPWIVAGARGLLQAFLLAALSFFSIWAQVDDVKLLISTPAEVFFGVLLFRWIGEGALDSWKGGKKNGGS